MASRHHDPIQLGYLYPEQLLPEVGGASSSELDSSEEDSSGFCFDGAAFTFFAVPLAEAVDFDDLAAAFDPLILAILSNRD